MTPGGAVEAAVSTLGSRPLGIDGVHVAAQGRRAVEQHWSPDVRRDVFSASKSVTALAVGIAEAEGLLSVDDLVVDHLPHLAGGVAAGMDRVTIGHLLTMSSGIAYRWDDPDSDHPGDPAVDILGSRPAAAPGEAFVYRGGNTYVASRVIHACTGADLRDYLVPRLFTPLGIRNPQWLRCPQGFSLGAVGLQLRTEELARLGRLLLEHGSWEGQSIVPADFIEAMTTDTMATGGHIATGASEPHPDNERYGRGVWLCSRDGAWRMDGIFGQFSIVLPNHHACVTVTAHYQGPTTDILDAVWSTIVPALDEA